MSSNANPQIPPDIVNITGSLLLGYLFNWLLLGVLSVQTYIYHLGFPSDRHFQKGTVGVVYVLEILQTVLSTRDAFREFGTGYGDMNKLSRIGWLWFSGPLLSALVCWIVQAFYAWHIRVLNRATWLSLIICVLSMAQFAGGIYEAVVAVSIGDLTELSQHNLVSTTFRTTAAVACDLVIVVTMFCYLRITKVRPHGENLGVGLRMFSEIMIEAGLLFTISAVLELGLFLGYRNATYHLAPALAQSKLYSNSMLAVLNGRLPFPLGVIGEGSRPINSTRLSFARDVYDETAGRISMIRSNDQGSQATSTTRAATHDNNSASMSRDTLEQSASGTHESEVSSLN